MSTFVIARVSVQNRQRQIGLDLPRLQSFTERALLKCLRIRPASRNDLSTLSEVGIVLVSDRRIAQLHRQFLGVSGPTDVITFQHGEIFISAETARRQARALRSSTEQEIQLYIVHGLLHLHGFDDTRPAAARKMSAVQNRIAQQAAAP
ncbi:MAG: rRNA maturation RNase YbeY [Verrucomicrobiota bacterium]|nr:rRNA maturation RNase YbeY [Verrucomicrobiota bacterium]